MHDPVAGYSGLSRTAQNRSSKDVLLSIPMLVANCQLQPRIRRLDHLTHDQIGFRLGQLAGKRHPGYNLHPEPLARGHLILSVFRVGT
jgi:hypothetical protein